jgi:hypothetical protein
MNRFLLTIAILIAISTNVMAQAPTQTVRGTVRDADSRMPLPFVTVCLVADTTYMKCTSTDEKGQWRLENVPLGRYTTVATMIGYNKATLGGILVQSGRESIADLSMEESVLQLEAAEISATQNRGEAMNQMATVSARTFNVEETDRYAGSRGDPARMASNYAGVQGADDSRNDIIIRGNTPLGVLWRVEGIDIPNPNHFGVAGTTGGPVTILNNKTLANSDFFTGAFPAEYGNAIAGVFDLKLRNGNTQKHEFTGQFGFLGTELMAEGPINREKGSSYLLNYRYSTLAMFGALNINIGTSAIPNYQDYFARISTPTKKGGSVSFFSFGGSSTIDILISEQRDTSEVDLYGENDRDQYFRTRMAVAGVTWLQPLNDKTFLRSTTAVSHERQTAVHEYVWRQIDDLGQFSLDSITPLLDYRFDINRISHHTFADYKLNRRSVLKGGIMADLLMFNFLDSVNNIGTTDWIVRWDTRDQAILLRPYIQWKYRFTDDLSMVVGLTSTFFTLNNTSSPIEPRAGLRYQASPKHILSAGVGLHSQTQPYYTYFYHLNATAGNRIYHNRDMGLTRSFHSVVGHEWYLKPDFRLKTEVYYQHLFDIPVGVATNSFSLINQGSGFSRFFPDSLQNTGTARNYGIELTVEKFFSKAFFVLVTGSLFDSKYKGSDGIERNTDFNSNYAVNLLVGKEFTFKNKDRLSLGTKVTTAGGRRYGIVDREASDLQKEIIFSDSLYNEFQFRPYFRLDLKVNYNINRGRFGHEFALDFVNVTRHRNILNLTYAPVPGDTDANPIRENYQLGFLPVFYYRIQF